MLTSEFMCAADYDGDISSQFVLLHMQVGLRFKIVALFIVLLIWWDITFPKVLLLNPRKQLLVFHCGILSSSRF